MLAFGTKIGEVCCCPSYLRVLYILRFDVPILLPSTIQGLVELPDELGDQSCF